MNIKAPTYFESFFEQIQPYGLLRHQADSNIEMSDFGLLAQVK